MRIKIFVEMSALKGAKSKCACHFLTITQHALLLNLFSVRSNVKYALTLQTAQSSFSNFDRSIILADFCAIQHKQYVQYK